MRIGDVACHRGEPEEGVRGQGDFLDAEAGRPVVPCFVLDLDLCMVGVSRQIDDIVRRDVRQGSYLSRRLF